MTTPEMERPAPASSRRQRSTTEVRQDELREALSHVGALMQLPPKSPTVAAPVAKAAKAAKAFTLGTSKGTRFWLPVIAVVMLAGVGAVTFWPSAPPTVPKALQREWATLHPKYLNNRIAFTATEVRLTDARGKTVSHAIESITTKFKGDSMAIVMTYRDEGGPSELSASLVSVPTPRLVFARPAGLVWDAVVR